VARGRHAKKSSWHSRGFTKMVGSFGMAGLIIGGVGAGLAMQPSPLSPATTPSSSAGTSTAGYAVAPKVTIPNQDPFSSPELSSYLASRSGTVTAGLYNVATGQTYLSNPGPAQVTASMVKIDLLADLLYQTQVQHRGLTPAETALVTTMVEASDNDAAQTLFLQLNQMPGLAAFNTMLGMNQTIGSWGWGLTKTTPADQLTLLKAIVLPNSVLTPANQAFEQTLMQNVYSSEKFGVPQGVPATATIGVKNGWYNEPTTGWQINTAGYVKLGTTSYFLCVETQGDPSEEYGKETVSQVGSLVWSFESTLPTLPSSQTAIHESATAP